MNVFTREHWWLVGAWVLYCALHSLLANPAVKRNLGRLLGSHQRFYRIFYSLFAFLSLVALLVYQYSFESPLLWHNPLWITIAAIPMILMALGVMLACIGKYFISLSGVDVFMKREVPSELQVGGLHRYVRHPLYAGTLLFLWSAFLLFPYLSHAIACFIITVYVWIGIGLEEKKLLEEYGNAYRNYASSVPKLVPDWRMLLSGRRGFKTESSKT